MKHIDNHLFNHNFPLLDQICLYLDPKKNEVTKFFFATFQAQDRSIIDSTQSTSLDDYKKQQNFFIQKHSQIFRILLKEEVSTLYKKIFKSPIPPEIKDLYNNKNIELDQVTLKIKETLASSFILLPEAVIEPLSLDTYPLSFLQEGRELLSIILRIRKAKTKEEALSEISPLENLHLSLSPEITSNLLLELCFYKFYAEQNINLCLAICTILEQWYEYIEVVRKLLQNQPILTEHRGWATGEAAEAGHLTTVQFILTGGNISEAHLGRATERATEDSLWSGRSDVSRTNAEDSACPYCAEYPPVEKTVPLKRKGENLPRDAISGTEEKNGLFTFNPSMIVFVSAPVPPRTKSPSCSPTLVAPGSVCTAPYISPFAPAVVTISSGFKTVVLLSDCVQVRKQ